MLHDDNDFTYRLQVEWNDYATGNGLDSGDVDAEEKYFEEVLENGSCRRHQRLTPETRCSCFLCVSGDPDHCEYKDHDDCENCNGHVMACKNFKAWKEARNDHGARGSGQEDP